MMHLEEVSSSQAEGSKSTASTVSRGRVAADRWWLASTSARWANWGVGSSARAALTTTGRGTVADWAWATSASCDRWNDASTCRDGGDTSWDNGAAGAWDREGAVGIARAAVDNTVLCTSGNAAGRSGSPALSRAVADWGLADKVVSAVSGLTNGASAADDDVGLQGVTLAVDSVGGAAGDGTSLWVSGEALGVGQSSNGEDDSGEGLHPERLLSDNE